MKISVFGVGESSVIFFLCYCKLIDGLIQFAVFFPFPFLFWGVLVERIQFQLIVTSKFLHGGMFVHLKLWFGFWISLCLNLRLFFRFSAHEDEDDSNLMRRTTIGNGFCLSLYVTCLIPFRDWASSFSLIINVSVLLGPPDYISDWTRELDSELSNQNANNPAFSRKYWRLLQCQNG